MPTSSLPFALNIAEISFSGLLWWVMAGATLIFVIHAAVATYHWFTFGSERFVSLLSTIIYWGVGGFILLAMLATLAVI